MWKTSRRYRSNWAGSGDQLFVSYEKDGVASIRQKTVSNRLLSLTLEGPFTKSYRVGDDVSLAGLVVTANYQNGTTRVLEPGEYTVTSFSTQTVGTHLAQVNFGGVSNSFVYEVFADTPAPERQPVVFRDPSGTYGAQTVPLRDDNRVTAPAWKRTGYTLTWSRALTGLQGGEVITAVWTPVPPATPKLTGIKSTGYQSIQLSLAAGDRGDGVPGSTAKRWAVPAAPTVRATSSGEERTPFLAGGARGQRVCGVCAQRLFLEKGFLGKGHQLYPIGPY